MIRNLCLGVLLAAPLFSQSLDPRIEAGELRWFTLDEDKIEIAGKLGNPRTVAHFGADFESWQFQLETEDTHEFSHQVVFRVSDRSIVSVTRTWEQERDIDAWFPASETSYHAFSGGGQPAYSVGVRRLPNGRLLIAMGAAKPGDKSAQIVLIRESQFRFFFPWLEL